MLFLDTSLKSLKVGWWGVYSSRAALELFGSACIKSSIYEYAIPFEAGPVLVQPTANTQLVYIIEALAR